MHKKLALLAAGVALMSANAFAVTHSEVIASTCLSCHGPAGKSAGAIPSLAGLDKAYFVTAMQEFKSGKRPGTIMKRHAAGYNDAEFAEMAAYFANLK